MVQPYLPGSMHSRYGLMTCYVHPLTVEDVSQWQGEQKLGQP